MTIGHAIQIENVPIVVQIRSGEDLLGTLQFSKGGLTWFRRDSPTPINRNGRTSLPG